MIVVFENLRKERMGQNHWGCLHREGEVGSESSWGLDLFWIIGGELGSNSVNKALSGKVGNK